MTRPRAHRLGLKDVLETVGALGDIRYDSMSLGEARNLQVMIKIIDAQLSRRIDQLERKRTHPEDHLIKAKEAAAKLSRSVSDSDSPYSRKSEMTADSSSPRALAAEQRMQPTPSVPCSWSITGR